MTKVQALAEARRRWGQRYGEIRHRGSQVLVGYMTYARGTSHFVIAGFGGTWEEAFSDADRRLAADANQREKGA